MAGACSGCPTSFSARRTEPQSGLQRGVALPVDLMPQDEHEIREVLLRYATGIDRRDWSLFATCFAEDFVGDYGSFGCWTGAQQITQYMRNAHAALGPTLHRLTNIDIRQQGTATQSRTYVDALLMSAEVDGEPRQGIGYYDDEWNKTSEGWKIRRRRFTLVRQI
jgi:hypothetical protein